jgi:hypothetical protein
MTREELNEDIHQEIEEEEQKQKKKKIIKIIIKLFLAITIFLILFYSYTTYISTVKIKVREYRIINQKIPDSFNGLKIIQLSDLHFGSTMFTENVQKIKKMINERKPDIVVFTGDLISQKHNLTSEEQETLIKELQKINATLGKYAILGDEDSENVLTIFNQSNFTILKNEYDLIYKDNNTPILLVGISSTSKEQDIPKAYSYFQQEIHNANIYTIALLHEPDIVDNILSTYPTDLFLAGHSHNGTIRIPFIDEPLIKTKGAIKYNQDFYKVSNSELYISSGLGTETGIRLFCRPSINFFRLSNE